jgi:uncharacterized membrane protein
VRGEHANLDRLEDLIEIALKVGLGVSTALLLAGLVLGWFHGTLFGLDADAALRYGILLLMVTPVVRVIVVTVGLAVERDWLFTVVSLFVLAVLASGISVAVRR